jgi:hypothetical protein
VYRGRFPPRLRIARLVAQHDDLKLPLTTTTGEHADETSQKPVQQTHHHDAQSEPARPRSPTRRSRRESNFFTPQAAVTDQNVVGGETGQQRALVLADRR